MVFKTNILFSKGIIVYILSWPRPFLSEISQKSLLIFFVQSVSCNISKERKFDSDLESSKNHTSKTNASEVIIFFIHISIFIECNAF